MSSTMSVFRFGMSTPFSMSVVATSTLIVPCVNSSIEAPRSGKCRAYLDKYTVQAAFTSAVEHICTLSQMPFALNAPFKVLTSPGEGNVAREALTAAFLRHEQHGECIDFLMVN